MTNFSNVSNALYNFVPEKVTRLFITIKPEEDYGVTIYPFELLEYVEGESSETETAFLNLIPYDDESETEGDFLKEDLRELNRNELNDYAGIFEDFSEGIIEYKEFERRVKALLNIE